MLSTGAAHAQSTKADQLKQRLHNIDTLIEKVLKDWRVPGVAVAVVYKNEVILSKGYGYRDLDNKLPVTAETCFPIASCTKAFTATVVGIAADKKLLDLDKPVNIYFPELSFYTEQLTSMLTAKDMLTHRTGLPRHDWVTHSKVQLPADTLIRRIRYLEPSKLFRNEAQYNNLMYGMLGELTRKLTGKSWADQVKEYIFAPLEMNNSNTGFNDLTKSKEYSLGYILRRDTLVGRDAGTEGAYAAGSIISNVTDMSHWLMAWINNGKYKEQQVVSSKFAREASTPQMSTPSRPNPNVPAYPDAMFGDLGYGWVIDAYRGHYEVQHSGDLPAFSSHTTFFPTDSIGIVVLANRFNSTIPELIAHSIADRVLDLPYKDWNGLLLALQQKRNAPATTPTAVDTTKKTMRLPLEKYTGTYYHGGYGFIAVSLTDGKLTATHNEQAFRFDIAGNDDFNANVPGGKLTAMMNKKNKVIALKGSFEEGISDIVFGRVK